MHGDGPEAGLEEAPVVRAPVLGEELQEADALGVLVPRPVRQRAARARAARGARGRGGVLWLGDGGFHCHRSFLYRFFLFRCRWARMTNTINPTAMPSTERALRMFRGSPA